MYESPQLHNIKWGVLNTRPLYFFLYPDKLTGVEFTLYRWFTHKESSGEKDVSLLIMWSPHLANSKPISVNALLHLCRVEAPVSDAPGQGKGEHFWVVQLTPLRDANCPIDCTIRRILSGSPYFRRNWSKSHHSSTNKFLSNMLISKHQTAPKVGHLMLEMILESDTMSYHWFEMYAGLYTVFLYKRR